MKLIYYIIDIEFLSEQLDKALKDILKGDSKQLLGLKFKEQHT